MDRTLCNDDWSLDFPEAHVKVLTRVEFFNHHPILIYLNKENNTKKEKWFCFKSVWILRETFHEEIEKSWRNDARMDANLREDREDINSWKINTFEKVLNRKKELMARLLGIHSSMQIRDNI